MREDVELMAGLGLNAYRFSVSWPRVLPRGIGQPNVRGLDVYDRLVDLLLEHGIRPFLTLYHWDLPQALQERGGWGSPDAPKWFAEYASVVASRVGDRVRDWTTLNEPQVFAFAGHLAGHHAPGLTDWRLALRVVHHALLAHRTAADALRSLLRGPRIGIALDLHDCHPLTRLPDDEAAAVRMDGSQNRWFLDPLFGRGYPRDLVAAYGSLLPRGAVDAMHHYHGRLDFLGLNYYSPYRVEASSELPLRAALVEPAVPERTAMGWEVRPVGLRQVLERLAREYGPPALYVTENGAAYDDEPDASGLVDDEDRRSYFDRHVAEAARAVQAGVPLEGYFAWSLLDNFEWAEGYDKRFGLVRVDFPTQTRTVKASGTWYRGLIAAWRRRVVAARPDGI
jgi:beta-glucosidase